MFPNKKTNQIFLDLEHVSNPRQLPHQHFFSMMHEYTVREHFTYELKSWIGRTFLCWKPKRLPTELQLLQVGCGFNFFEGWTNADFYSMRFWKNKFQWMIDLRYPLKCDDNFWDGIFTEHVVEHLPPYHAYNLFKEFHRILKKDKYLRIIVPDFRQYVALYEGRYNHPVFEERWDSPIEAVRAYAQNWGHRSLWDAELMKRCLLSAGFSQVQEVSFRQGSDSNLLKDDEKARFESLYIEAKK